MNNYLIEITETISHFLTVTAQDEQEALELAEAGCGEAGQSTAPELTYKHPRLLSNPKG